MARPFQRRRGGKAYGNFIVEVQGGARVNLGTKDATEALRRAKRAKKGERDFVDSEAAEVAQALGAAVAGTEGAKTPPVVEPPRSEPAGLHPPQGSSPAVPTVAALPPIAPPAGAPPAASATPDGYRSPAGWSAALGAAAAATEQAQEEAAKEEEEPPEVLFDRGFVEEVLGDAATLAVELQIMAQAWALSRGAIPGVKVKAATVSDSALGRVKGRKAYLAWFKTLVPTDLPVPTWVLAPLLVAVTTLPVQLGPGCSVIDPNAPPAPPAPAAAPEAAK